MYYDYPELYYMVYPRIIETLNQNVDENYLMSKLTITQIEEMVNDIYIMLIYEFPEIHEDPYEKKFRGQMKMEGLFLGRERLAKDLVRILLNYEILRRNRGETLL